MVKSSRKENYLNIQAKEFYGDPKIKCWKCSIRISTENPLTFQHFFNGSIISCEVLTDIYACQYFMCKYFSDKFHSGDCICRIIELLLRMGNEY